MSGFGLCTGAIALADAMPSAVVEPLNYIERSKFVRHLADNYDEMIIATRLADNGSFVQVMSSKSGETWT